MRLRSDEFAAELARQRCASPAVDESSAPGHVSADARGLGHGGRGRGRALRGCELRGDHRPWPGCYSGTCAIAWPAAGSWRATAGVTPVRGAERGPDLSHCRPGLSVVRGGCVWWSRVLGFLGADDGVDGGHELPDLVVRGDEGRADLYGVAAQRTSDEPVLDEFVGDRFGADAVASVMPPRKPATRVSTTAARARRPCSSRASRCSSSVTRGSSFSSSRMSRLRRATAEAVACPA